MRNLSVLVTVMVAMLVCPKFASAQEPKEGDREGVRERIAARMADLHLSDGVMGHEDRGDQKGMSPEG